MSALPRAHDPSRRTVAHALRRAPLPGDGSPGDNSSEDGFTLIEILLTLVIISTVILALFTATIAIYAYSAAQRDLAILNGALSQRVEQMSGVPVSGGSESSPASTPNQYSSTDQICIGEVESRSRPVNFNPSGSSQAVLTNMTPTHYWTLDVAPSGQTSYRRAAIDTIGSGGTFNAELAAQCRQAPIYQFDVTAEYRDRETTFTVYRSWKP